MIDIETIKKDYKEILNQLSDPELISDWSASAKATAGKEKFEELSKKKNFLEKILAKEKEISEIKNNIEENKLLILAREDEELVSLAETEIIQLREKEKFLQRELDSFVSKEKKGPPQSVIVEIRAGTGGEEAGLFAADLFRMYSRYAQKQGWRQKVLHSHSTELGGLKEIIFELRDGDVFSEMKYEGGVHRIQRIPLTEKAGRIHTSTASVAVLPKPKKAEIKINPKDIKTDFFKASGAGGQYVNKRMTAIRLTHLPTGVVVASQSERNLAQNRENAMAILEAKLLEKKEMAEFEKLSKERKTQIGWAKRAEKIRTYNFPQDRITDHRIKKSWHNIEEVMGGKLEMIISVLKKSFPLT